MPFGHDVVAEAECIGIFAILINTLYLKKETPHNDINFMYNVKLVSLF
jgi:hypothetical protein